MLCCDVLRFGGLTRVFVLPSYRSSCRVHVTSRRSSRRRTRCASLVCPRPWPTPRIWARGSAPLGRRVCSISTRRYDVTTANRDRASDCWHVRVALRAHCRCRRVQVRPVPLEIRIQGFDISHLGARLLAMARPTFGAVSNFCSPGNPGLVFVPTRKQAQLTAIDLVSFAGADGRAEVFLHAGAGSGEVRRRTLALASCCSLCLYDAVSHGFYYVLCFGLCCDAMW